MTTALLCGPSDMFLYGKSRALQSINITLISHFFVGVRSIMKSYLKALHISKVVLQTVCQYQFSLKLIVLLTPDIPINPHIVVHFPSLVPAGNQGPIMCHTRDVAFVIVVVKEQQKSIPSKPFTCASFALGNPDHAQMNFFKYTIAV